MNPIFLMLIVGFLALLIILQIIFIRNRIKEFKSQIMDKTLDVSKTARDIAQSESKFRVYGITVDLALTKTITTSPQALLFAIKEIVTRDSVSLPYVCDSGSLTVPSKIDKISILVLQPNAGSTTMVRDILNKEIRYILFNSEVYMIDTFPSLLSDTIIPFFNEQKMDRIADSLSSKFVVVLYALANHTPDSYESITADCSFSILPFMGEIRKKVDAGTFFNAMPNIMDNVANVHVVGYKTL